MFVADYDITVDGEIAGGAVTAFAPHQLEVRAGTTVITAAQLDQAALLTLLMRARDLALTIMRVERITQVAPEPIAVRR